jgi:hypothetical protein
MDEVEAAFQEFWTVGSLDENWAAWPDRLTEDVHYVEHVFGVMHGRHAVRAWITELMAARTDVHAVLDWYIVKGDRLVLSMQNRYFNPEPGAQPYDFPGLTVLEYGGKGLFGYEEDYWDVAAAKACHVAFTDAVERCGGRGLDGGRYEELQAERRAATLAVFARGG